MITVGLTGGIGAGKSLVAEQLGARGAQVVDTDVLARAALAPGSPGFAAVRARFGPEVVAPDGSIDRSRLAAIVFHDRAARADLEAIVHPAVRDAVGARLAELEAAGALVAVVVVPLLVEAGAGSYRFDKVLVVDAPEELALARLVGERAMAESDARARLATQATRAARLEVADFVIDNIGSRAELALMVDNAWRWMRGLVAADAPGH